MAYKDPEQEKEYHRKWREKNKVKLNAYQKEWSKKHPGKKAATRRKLVINNPEKSMLYSSKFRAKKNNVEFTITKDDINIPLICPVLRQPIIKECIEGGKTGPKGNSPSIDRIDNSKGYIPGNIQIISNKANTMKSSATPEELINFALWVFATHGKEIYEIRKVS
jgi:hypothetical protein